MDLQDPALALFAGLFEPAPWDAFTRRLLARSGADRARVILRGSGDSTVLSRAGTDPQTTPEQVESEYIALDLLDLSAFRPGRVYALDELRRLDDPTRRAAQDQALAEARIGDARLLRIAGAGFSTWLILFHQRPVLGAPDSALLTAQMRPVELAVATLSRIEALRLRAAAAEQTLARLGLGQAVLDRAGQVVEADPAWTATMPPASGPAMSPFAEPAAAMTPGREPALIPTDRQPVLLRPFAMPSTGLPASAAALAAIRTTPPRHDPASAARVLASALGLSTREAALAVLLARGQALVEAGQTLRLTPETARNYSKRIYAKTGARGQADLVRMVLESLAVLA